MALARSGKPESTDRVCPNLPLAGRPKRTRDQSNSLKINPVTLAKITLASFNIIILYPNGLPPSSLWLRAFTTLVECKHIPHYTETFGGADCVEHSMANSNSLRIRVGHEHPYLITLPAMILLWCSLYENYFISTFSTSLTSLSYTEFSVTLVKYSVFLFKT